MKQPDEPVIGGARKTLPSRKARKIQRSIQPSVSQRIDKSSRKKTILNKNVEQELVKVFGEH